MDKQKQKQIEEMYNLFLNYKYDQLDWKKFDCIDKDLFEFFYNAGYRKIDKNAVVLTEERNKIICDRFAQLESVQAELQELNAKYYNEAKDLRREVKKVRKETAEKFVSLLEQRCKEKEGYEYSFGNIRSVIDKVCKEITEGKV